MICGGVDKVYNMKMEFSVTVVDPKSVQLLRQQTANSE